MILIILPFTMSTLTDLIDKIDNQDLRARISQEVNRLTKQKKFGLVFEEHLPECTPLYDLKVKKGSTVAIRVVDDSDGNRKLGSVDDTYTVLNIEGSVARCERHQDKSIIEQSVDNLVVVAQFGMPIYPFLKEIDSICNAPNSKLWHALIEADNYHALQLLVYLYGGMVDCIYIDPPYNTGDKSWKYNNDYVDSSDEYRHSKWLSMMKRRLKVAKQLLNPKDSVLILTIDEKEYLHIGCLLEEMFPEANIQMISSIIAQKGVARSGSFYRTNEFLYMVQLGKSRVSALPLDDAWQLGKKASAAAKGIVWSQLRRSGTNDLRTDRLNLFYPIIFNKDGNKIVGTGDALDPEKHPKSPIEIKGDLLYLWPIKETGVEGNWQMKQDEVMARLKKGYIKVGKRKDDTIPLSYLKKGSISKIENGDVSVVGYEKLNGTVIVDASDYTHEFVPGSQWNIASHDATYHGSQLLDKLLPSRVFPFPKSLYAVRDTLRFFVANKPNALIVDFFSGSGTTLHAVNLLNAEFGGNRRCIMVTNNEISAEEAKGFLKEGVKPGSEKWENRGIARYITWPRTICSIKGIDANGKPLEGQYVDTDIKMSDGFKSNAVFYRLGFLDKNAVALGRQFKELIPLLWMKAGAIGECPKLPLNQPLPKMMVCSENKFAVLIDELYYKEFAEELDKNSDIETVYIVTDSESGYREMAAHLKVKKSYQLYRDYLDNFRINKAAR